MTQHCRGPTELNSTQLLVTGLALEHSCVSHIESEQDTVIAFLSSNTIFLLF